MANFDVVIDGTEGRTRTGTGFTPMDFESIVSTNFTTPALLSVCCTSDQFYGDERH